MVQCMFPSFNLWNLNPTILAGHPVVVANCTELVRLFEFLQHERFSLSEQAEKLTPKFALKLVSNIVLHLKHFYV